MTCEEPKKSSALSTSDAIKIVLAILTQSAALFAWGAAINTRVAVLESRVEVLDRQQRNDRAAFDPCGPFFGSIKKADGTSN